MNRVIKAIFLMATLFLAWIPAKGMCVANNVLTINGGFPLNGQVPISGARNAAIPILFGTLLSKQTVSIENIPDIADIRSVLTILKQLGVQVRQKSRHTYQFTPPKKICIECVDLTLAKDVRIMLFGALIHTGSPIELPYPDENRIAKRPVNIHLMGLKKLGAQVSSSGHSTIAHAPNGLTGAKIVMPRVTVTGTENIILAAMYAKGPTTIYNSARTPEVVDFIKFLNSMGANITGAGTSIVHIEPVEKLTGTTHRVISDRNEAGTFLVAAAATQGNITITNINDKQLTPILMLLKQAGATIQAENNTIHLEMNQRPLAVNYIARPYPGLSTDLQSVFSALNTVAEGKAHVIDEVFVTRFQYLQSFKEMGANIKQSYNRATIIGSKLHDKNVVINSPTEMRGAAATAIVALARDGHTEIKNLTYINRAYEDFVAKLKLLGARVHIHS